jgi:L-ascorbate metabolism protein UlaG (beta-lactamase superfamily)
MTDGTDGRQPTLTFVGTATTVLRLGPFTLLTDPNFISKGQLAYLGKGLMSRRRTEPALRIADLPPLDGVVLSHLHGDHWDRVARGELDRSLPVFTTQPAARTLARRQGFRAAVGLATWQAEQLQRDGATLRITALPGRHAKGAMRALLPPVMGSLLELDRAGLPPYRLYITGDTLLVDELAEIAERYPDLDAAVVHLGGTRVLGAVVTMDAEQGCGLLDLVRPGIAVPVHYDDYGAFKSGLDEFAAAAKRWGWSDRVRYVARGDTVSLTP